MTVILAKRYANKIVMCADKRICYGEHFTDDCNKIFHIGDWTIAGSGAVRCSDIIATDKEVQKAFLESCDKHTLIKNVIAKIVHSLETNNQIISQKNFPEMDSSFLLIHKSGIYIIHSDFSVTRHKKFATIGSGQAYATSLLRFTDMNLDKIVRKISKLDRSVSKKSDYMEIKVPRKGK